MADGLLVLLLLLNVYVVALFLLHQRGRLRGPSLELAGPLLLWRTEQGKQLLEKLSRPRRFWKAYGDVGVVVSYAMGALVLAVLVLQLSLLFTHKDILKQAAPNPESLLVIPGVNPFIPLWYGILALVVALVVHEGAHGVLARAHDIKVKSLGLLFLVVPIGAFVEPDDEELERARTRAKNRVFAAGVMTNLVVCVLAAAVFTSMWASAGPVHEGLGVNTVIPLDGLGAEAAGMQPGMVITAIDGQPVRNLAEFNATLSQKHAGETVRVDLWLDGAALQRQVTLADKYAYYEARDPSANREEFKGRGFMGVSTVAMTRQPCPTLPFCSMEELKDLESDPLGGGLARFAVFIALPLQGLSPVPQAHEHFFAAQGAWGALPAPAFWMLLNSMYWVFWLNLMVGSFNALPAGPLDGGQMFKASLKGALRHRFGVRRDRLVVEKPALGRQVVVRGADSATQAQLERVDSIVRRTTLTVGLVILALILVPIVGPRLL
jgi:membrane-associated protease RseP (regulator of RpoE activity)